MARPGDLRRQLVIAGDVQNVGYRAACARRAHELGLAGHVRNQPDGTVLVVVEGDRHAVDALTAWCRIGPPMASVAHVDITDGQPTGEHGFTIAR